MHRHAARDRLATAGAWALGLAWLAPLLYAAWTAFHSAEYATRFDLLAPMTLENFARAWAAAPFPRYFLNTVLIVALIVGAQCILCTLAAYAFARYRFRGKSAMFLGLMLTRTVPGIALSLPLFFVYARLDIIDTHFGLILAYVALNVPFTIWLIDGFFRQVPLSLSEAAQVDGCTPWQAFWKIEFPLARSGIAAAGVFAFLTSWNEFALASQLTRSTSSKTLPVGLLDFTAQFTIDWAGMCAMAVIIIIPALILTFLVQKHLIAGLTFGGVKG